MKKIIGFDIDGVLTNGDRSPWEVELIRYFNLELGEEPFQGDFRTRFNLSEEQMLAFYDECSHLVFPHLIMRDGADQLLAELKEAGFTIILITARTVSEETPKWLKQNGIPYDLLVNSHEKLPPCLQHQVEIFVEDSLNNAESVSTAIPVLLVDMDYNRVDNLPSQIYRVNDLEDIRKFITDYYQKLSA